MKAKRDYSMLYAVLAGVLLFSVVVGCWFQSDTRPIPDIPAGGIWREVDTFGGFPAEGIEMDVYQIPEEKMDEFFEQLRELGFERTPFPEEVRKRLAGDSDTAMLVEVSNGLLSKGYYEFGADGKMLQGVVEKADGLYYYNLGNTQYMGLIERDGEYYYVNEGGKLEIGRVWVGTYASNGILRAGYYEFGADGAMLNGFETLADGLYYYNKGTAQYLGLKVIDGDLYYIEEGGKVMTGRVWVGTYASNGLVPRGNYTFAADGKFVG